MSSIHFPKDRSLDIVSLGRICIDFNPVDLRQSLGQCENFKKYVGGSPANIAIGMSRLGRKVGFLGVVSNDQFGSFVLEYMKKQHIDTSHITYCKNNEKLGLAFTEVLESGESRLLMYRENAADLQLSAETIDEAYIASAKMLLISGTALSQSPSREATLKAIQIAKKVGTIVVFDIDFRDYSWKSEEDISLYYMLAAKESDIILGSREEFELTSRLVLDTDVSDCEIADYWHKWQAKIVVIKHGKKGSMAFTKQNEQYRVIPFQVNCQKGFGGGDGYASAFLHAMLAGQTLASALEMGSASAAILVSAHSCSDAMPTETQIREFISKNKPQFETIVTPL